MASDSEVTPEQLFDDWLCDEFMDRFHLNKKYGKAGVDAAGEVIEAAIEEYRKRFNPWNE